MYKDRLFNKRVGRACQIALTISLIFAGSAFAQNRDQMLSRVPTQIDVDVDYPSDDEKGDCKVKAFKESGYQGVALYKPDGKTLLRVWCAQVKSAAGKETKATVEQIRFYKDGQEVYRDVLGKEARWLNVGGSKRGAMASDKKTIANWIVISPEEATKEIVAALATKDFARYQRVALSADDLASLKLSGAIADEVRKEVQEVNAEDFAKLAQTLNLPEDVRWGAFNTSTPGTIPAGDGFGEDLTVYYNAAIVVMSGEGDATQSQQIYVGDLVKIGDAWRIVGLPSGEPFGQATGAVSASSLFFPAAGGASAADAETANQVGEMGTALTEAYQKLETASPQEYPALCDQTVELMLNIAENNPQSREDMISQAVDAVFSGVQSGMYPDGAAKLQELAEKYNDSISEGLRARIRHRQITADFYAVAQAQPQPKPAELNRAQEKYSEELTAFVEEYASTDAGAEAAMNLALDQEFMMDNEAALTYYRQVAQNFSDAVVGKRAQGAIARLQSEGDKPSLPAMKYFGGGVCDLNALVGKPTVVFCWGSWDQDGVSAMKALASKVNVVGLNVDTAPDPENAQQYYQQIFKGLPWKNVCDPAGFDGAPAIALGVQTAPWIILIDKEGKVVRANITNVDDLSDIIDEMK